MYCVCTACVCVCVSVCVCKCVLVCACVLCVCVHGIVERCRRRGGPLGLGLPHKQAESGGPLGLGLPHKQAESGGPLGLGLTKPSSQRCCQAPLLCYPLFGESLRLCLPHRLGSIRAAPAGLGLGSACRSSSEKGRDADAVTECSQPDAVKGTRCLSHARLASDATTSRGRARRGEGT